MLPRMFRLSASLLGVSVLVLLLWSLLLAAAPVHSGVSLDDIPARSSIITDTRWIELIRSGGPEPQLTRSAAALPTLNLHLTDNLIAGRASSPALITIVMWRNNSVIVNTSATPYPDGANYFYAVQFCPSYLPLGGGGCPILQPGDAISLTQSGASVIMTVPVLTARVDASTDRVFGSAPISSVVTTYLYPFANSTEPYTQTVNVDTGGQYQADYAGTLDVRPRDNGYVAYSEAPGRTTYIRCVAPFLRAQVGGPEVSGLAAPLSSVVITAANAAGTPYFYWWAYATSDGSFGVYSSYGGIKLSPGDHITATSAGQTFSMMVLTLTAHIDLANHLIWGAAPANQAVEASRFDGPLCCSSNSFWNDWPTEQTVVTTTATGQYSATLALTRPNYGAAIATAPDGNQTYARWAVPYLSAWMGNRYWRAYWLTGQVDDVATPVTITIQGPSGYFKDVRSAMAASDGYYSDFSGMGLTLDSGDVITVTTTRGVQAALQLPNLTGQIDPVTDIVSGTAPPNARLTLTIYDSEPIVVAPPTPAPTSTPYHIAGGGPPATPYTVIVTATTQGNYLVNLHGVLDLNNASTGEVSLTTAEGYGVSRVLSLSRQEGCDLRPSWINVGGNQVAFWPAAKGCSQYTYGSVRLRDAAGHLKAEQALPLWPSYYDFSIYFYTGTQPVAIVPGDVIEVAWSNSPQFEATRVPTSTPRPITPTPYTVRSTSDQQLVTIVVPTLTVQLDPAANIISGQAPANTTVELSLSRYPSVLQVFTTTVDAQGNYTLSLAPDASLEAGDTARVTYIPIDPPAFSAVGVLPMVRVQLYQTYADGFLPPLAAFTATLQTTPSVPTAYKGTASNDGYFYVGLSPVKPGDTVVVTTAQRILRLSVPALTAHVDRASATVFGQAPPLARLRVEPYNYYGVSQNVTATASGNYSASFPSLAPLNTTYGKLTYFNAEGNQAISYFATVHWGVVVDNKCWNGIVDMAGGPLTATLRNNSGGLKNTLVFTPTYQYYSACFTTTVQSGDQIFLQSAPATEVFTVPLLTARHNYGLQAVEGLAPPNHDLYFEAWWGDGAYRHVYSDNSGHYGVDTSDLHPPLQSRGDIYLRDEAGNTTWIYFTVTGYSAFLPIVRR
jgi:hypothetical protein